MRKATYLEKSKSINKIQAIQLKLASPDDIVSWSFGEVTKPETINYRTFKPERDGLFCAKIFGPIADYECLCGKFKRMKYKGITCDKCGVEVIPSKVRRERMGHIVLASPVSHIWYLKGTPPRISTILSMKNKDVESANYYEQWIVTDPKFLVVEPEKVKEAYRNKYPQDTPQERNKVLKNIDEMAWQYDKVPKRKKDAEQHFELLMKFADNALIYNPDLEGENVLRYKALLYDKTVDALRTIYGKDSFSCSIGASAIKELLSHFNQTCQCPSCQNVKSSHKTRMECQRDILRSYLKIETNIQKKTNTTKRLRIIESCLNSDIKPEWMVLEVLPVIPPELRPLVPLDGGRFATSDLNDLYRRVINRNNRLKRLIDMKAPDVIIRNEKRMLQEAVDALFDNGRRGRVIRGSNNRPLKSLSDTLKGKQGRFRQNLLGKRVDYSGRSVIVVGPELKLNQCGLPKIMALELFKPFICNKLQERGYVQSFKEAKSMVDRGEPEVYDVLDDVIQSHPVLLNRAPTLHRLGIQAFEPVLVEGKAIKLHPLVCTAFNADFDGDQMAVHIPLSPASQAEANILMLSSNNLLYPANGTPITVPTQDMVLGIYYLTLALNGQKGEGKAFPYFDEAYLAWQSGYVSLHSKIKIKFNGKYIDLDHNPDLLEAETFEAKNEMLEVTVGRLIFNSALPEGMPLLLGLIKKKQLKDIFTYAFRVFGREALVKMADQIKSLGFTFATSAGISFGLEDMEVPKEKTELVDKALNEVDEVEKQYREGAITNRERKNKVVDIWNQVTDQVADAMFNNMKQKQESKSGSFNPIYIMADSGARGSKQQIRQLAGMRGLMAKPSGEIIEQPIIANFREGLTVLEYFNSSHGARKGLADTALKTADAGYLTRRLVDVAQDVIITEDDCHTLDGIFIQALTEGGRIIEPLRNRIVGRVALDDIRDPYSREIIVNANELITEELAKQVEEAGIERVKIRSVLTCETRRGVCAKCYGRNLSSSNMVELGEAIGVMAAQSIGEPGTQLTMRTFHIGGTATKEAMETQHIAKNIGKVKLVNIKTIEDESKGKGKKDLISMNRGGFIVIEDEKGREREKYPVVYGAHIKVKDGQSVKSKDVLVEWDPYTNPILTDVGGKIEFKDIIDGVTVSEQTDPVTGLRQRVTIEPKEATKEARILVKEEGKKSHFRSFSLPSEAHIMVEDGQDVVPGTILAKIPRETSKTKDIVGGLPRVVELFEARHPKNPAVVTEIDGEVHYDKKSSAQRKIIIDNARSGEKREYNIPKGVHISVLEGEWVHAGDQLCEGSADPHEILRVLGIKDLQSYLVNEIQEVYRLQGVTINDKHIEVIVRQMMRWMKIEEVGDSKFLVGQQVDRFEFQKENQKILNKNKVPAIGKPLLLGITKAALATDSWISAASFQETTRILTEASLCGQIDYLRGLKENVILGRLIPAGTGFYKYHDVELEKDETIKEDSVDTTDYLSISYADAFDFLNKETASDASKEFNEEEKNGFEKIELGEDSESEDQ